ncbi:hypothetical protein IWX63_001467 [Arthrobacter sp. CAN_A2]
MYGRTVSLLPFRNTGTFPSTLLFSADAARDDTPMSKQPR